MKRDPRLRRLGERRSPRRLHAPARLHPSIRLLLLLQAEARAAERAFLDGLLRHAARTSARLTEQIRDDHMLHGTAYLHVSFDDAPLLTRVDPADVEPTIPEFGDVWP